MIILLTISILFVALLLLAVLEWQEEGCNKSLKNYFSYRGFLFAVLITIILFH